MDMFSALSKAVTNLVREVGRSRRGFYRVVAFIVIFSGLYLLAVRADPERPFSFGAPTILIMAGLAFSIYDYLAGEKRSFKSFSGENEHLSKAQEASATKLVESLTRSLAQYGPRVPSKDRQKYVEEFSATLSKHLKEALGSELQYEAKHSQFVRQGELMRSRLQEEIEEQGRRGRVNLTIGAIFAFFGIGALGYFALLYEYKGVDDLLVRFVPRMSFVLLVEVFSYFFLNLYRHSIFEIKYFQNELTNIEDQILALQGCLLTGDQKALAKICEQIAKTERNFILKKGETTMQNRELEGIMDHDKNLVENMKGVIEAVLHKRPTS